MEAKKIKQKKVGVSKGKLKKTIKNVICRPDPVFWPLAHEEEAAQLTLMLNKHSVNVPQFKKLLWKELKLIPKDKRPKPPPLKRVPGLIFGITECRQLIEKKECQALLIEASVNPITIVQPIINNCLQSSIPVLCIQDLKKVCANNFSIPTCCLGIQAPLEEIINKIQELYSRKQPKMVQSVKIEDAKENNNDKIEIETVDMPTFSYLYRTNNKYRMFIPSSKINTPQTDITEFAGQQYIKFAKEDNETEKVDRKKYLGMLLKRISSNPNKRKLTSE